MGSVGDKNTLNKDMNKYGFNFNQLVDIDMRQVASQKKGHYSTPGNYIYNELQSILNDFNDNIIYVKWQPIDSDGNIIYGQKQAIEHYITNYTKLSDYTAHIDVDEFIVSKNNTNIKDYIFNQSKDNVTKLIIKQKKMSDRFCDKQPINILDITNSIENIDTTGWAHKLIIKNDATNIENITSINIHSIKTTYGNTIDVPIDTIRFNHYNVNKKQIEWMKGYYNKNTIDDFTYGNDTTISQYSSIIKSLCKNKCSNKNNFINMDLVKKEYDNLCMSWGR